VGNQEVRRGETAGAPSKAQALGGKRRTDLLPLILLNCGSTIHIVLAAVNYPLPMPLTVAEFVHRWKLYAQTEEAGAKPHFLDLCDMLGQPHPAAADSVGENYAFEKRVRKTSGAEGYADVWYRDHFAWEYKGKHKDLKKAYNQLNDYREELGNPPLLVVCDLETFQVHTNWTNTSKRVYEFTLDDLNRNQVTATCPLPPLEVLRALFGDYNVLRPEYTDAQVTQEVAKKFAKLAERLELEDRSGGATREQVAHFLMRLLFCLFADSIGLLPDHLFRGMIQKDRVNPKKFLRKLAALFEAMSEPDGIFGEHSIKYFNGDLFNSGAVMQLDQADLGTLYDVSKNYNWSHVAPAIFGTLFERSLDPKRRSLIGAHYTSEDDIRTLIEPVLMRPLERRWEEVKRQILKELDSERAEDAARDSKQARLRVDRKSGKILGEWIEELTAIRVLDPACGSGNFLYVALRRMLDLWLATRNFAAEQGISLVVPKMVSPSQLYGIETEFYAHELASVVVWIGFLQWKHEHGVLEDREPILEKLTNIEHGDAILRYEADGEPYEPEWPKADFIIGNPPFVGGNRVRAELGDTYVDDLFQTYSGRVGPFADLVCYWFEKARNCIEKNPTLRAGLLATQGIRGGINREVLNRIKETGDIFFAESDRKWLLDGALVRISMIGFDDGSEHVRQLDGKTVESVHSNLSSGENTTLARPIRENLGICFMGVSPKGPFDIDPNEAQRMLKAPINVNRRPNSDVIKPVMSGIDIVGRKRNIWTIDFGTDMPESEAAKYELPFEYVRHHVYPVKQQNNRESYRKKWWLFAEPRPKMRNALKGKSRFIATPATAKHRIFVWIPAEVLCNQGTLIFARDDDYFIGVLQSTIHEVWALEMGTQLESRPRYTPDSTFDTFPFPWPPGHEPAESENPRIKAIADAARELVRLRDNWMNPPDASQEELKKRTLTNLYNQRPEWLANAHETLDRAVYAAYGWPSDLSKDGILARLLALNHERAAAQNISQ
jgi:type II restriction/modification system DNA methylase subunit YeeA